MATDSGARRRHYPLRCPTGSGMHSESFFDTGIEVRKLMGDGEWDGTRSVHIRRHGINFPLQTFITAGIFEDVIEDSSKRHRAAHLSSQFQASHDRWREPRLLGCLRRFRSSKKHVKPQTEDISSFDAIWVLFVCSDESVCQRLRASVILRRSRIFLSLPSMCLVLDRKGNSRVSSVEESKLIEPQKYWILVKQLI